MKPILSIKNLSKYYVNGKNVVAALNKVNLSFCRGEFAVITGESGSGKSTLAHILGGIIPYEDGEMLVNGKPTSHYAGADWETYRRDNISFISQNYGVIPGATVLDNVVSALYLTGMNKNEANAKAEDILKVVELWDLRSRRAVKLSSGQKQRLSIARALAKPCPILIADEPTGNLDPENSEKVMKLLAQAAEERLVILITHEYYETEGYATRHIRVHDGKIVSDMQIREKNNGEGVKVERKAGNHGIYTAFLQLRSRPVWTATLLLFLTLTAFAVFAFLGTFIVAIDDTSTRIYDNSAFMNGDKTRIVAIRKDGADMKQEDYDAILSIDYVECLERYGYIRDVNYSYQSGTDYEMHTNVHNVGSHVDPLYLSVKTVEVKESNQYLQTVPMMSGNENFLTAGRLPESFYEVVAADDSLLGKKIDVYICDFTKWSKDAYIKLNVTVVGTTDVGKGLYFSDDLGKLFTLNYYGTDYLCLPYEGDVIPEAVLVPMRSADTDNIVAVEVLSSLQNYETRKISNSERLVSLARYNLDVEATTWNVPNNTTYKIAGYKLRETVGISDSTYLYAVSVSPAVFSAYIDEGIENCGDQVSITIENYAYTDRVIKALEKEGYYSLSPYVLGSTKVNSKLEAQRQQTQIICLCALLAIALLQMLLVRVLFSMENESYKVLSNIGLTWRSAKRSVLIQIFVFALFGQVIALLAIFLGSAVGIAAIRELNVYLYGKYWAIIFATHWAMTLAAAWLVLTKLRKSVFPMAIVHHDLMPRSEGAEE